MGPDCGRREEGPSHFYPSTAVRLYLMSTTGHSCAKPLRELMQ